MTPERANELAEGAGCTWRASDLCRTLNFIERDYGRGIRSISVWDHEMPGMTEADFIDRIPPLPAVSESPVRPAQRSAPKPSEQQP